jgi:hypothetical protein
MLQESGCSRPNRTGGSPQTSNCYCHPGKDNIGVGSRGPGIPGGVASPHRRDRCRGCSSPTRRGRLRSQSTIVAVLELSGKNWLLGAVAPGLSRRMKRSFKARNVEAVVRALEQAKGEAAKAGLEVARIVRGFESGRDGFWIARALQQSALAHWFDARLGGAKGRMRRLAETGEVPAGARLTAY